MNVVLCDFKNNNLAVEPLVLFCLMLATQRYVGVSLAYQVYND